MIINVKGCTGKQDTKLWCDLVDLFLMNMMLVIHVSLV